MGLRATALDKPRIGFERHIQAHNYNAEQTRFLRSVQEVFLKKRTLVEADLYDPPLTNFGRNAVERFFTPQEIGDPRAPCRVARHSHAEKTPVVVHRSLLAEERSAHALPDVHKWSGPITSRRDRRSQLVCSHGSTRLFCGRTWRVCRHLCRCDARAE